MKVIISICVALGFHVFAGWEWSLLGAILAGFWVIKKGWLSGLLTLSLSWGLLIVLNLVVATQATQKYFEFAGSILGGLPSVVLPLATILVGGLLGALGGFVGSSLAGLDKEPVVVEIE